MLRNIKITVEYEGTRYHGWQTQQNAITIQQKLEEAVYRLCGEKRRVTGAGRTDTGVHARGQVANFRLLRSLPLHKIEMGLNAYLPDDIVVKKAEEVTADFDARFSARERVYQYYISTSRTAILRNFCWQFFKRFDPETLNRAAALIEGEHEFGAFARAEVQGRHKRCSVFHSRWYSNGNLWIFRISANRFLHGMVRTLVGTMMHVATGKYSLEEFQHIFASGDRTQAGIAAPARGLVLEEVIY